MGNLTSMCLCSSRGNSSARIRDSSIWYPQIGQHISIQTFRELNQVPMSSPMSTRTVTPLNGGYSRSTEEVLEEVASQLTTRMLRF
ncbi:AC4 protein [Cotton mosaic virus]|nr:AC4 protein [Cotton mosaic virus]